jgi:hypothetical protein
MHVTETTEHMNFHYEITYLIKFIKVINNSVGSIYHAKKLIYK